MVIMLTFSGFASGGEESGCPVTEYLTYHENGNLRLDAQINCEGQLHGTFVEYLADGSMWGYGEWVNGKRHGKWLVTDIYGDGQCIIYYDNGDKISAERQELVDGKMVTVETITFDQLDQTNHLTDK